MIQKNLHVERRLGDYVRTKLPAGLAEFVMFLFKQVWAALFGLLLLSAIIISALVWQDSWVIDRYDALFVFAVATQTILLVFKLESWNEAKVIFLFHVVGTIMEIYKVHMGSWSYPEPSVLNIEGVPLFSGFMYASVGSYMARVIRIFHMKFAPYPPFWMTVLLAAAIYLNFFLHHFTFDTRYILFAATLVLFWRCRIWFFVGATPRWMPLPLAAFLSAVFLWIAENIGTMTGTWIYNG